MFSLHTVHLTFIVLALVDLSYSTDDARIERLEYLVAEQARYIGDLEGRMDSQETRLSSYESVMAKMKTDLATCGTRLEGLVGLAKGAIGNKDKRLLADVFPTTAFYAYMSKNEGNMSPHTLSFDVVKTNILNGYDANTGIFTVERAGPYVFTFSLRIEGASSGTYDIVRNGIVEGSSIAIIQRSSNGDWQQHVTGTVVIEAKAGDEVYIRVSPSYSHSGVAILSNLHGYSMFAGWSI